MSAGIPDQRPESSGGVAGATLPPAAAPAVAAARVSDRSEGTLAAQAVPVDAAASDGGKRPLRRQSR